MSLSKITSEQSEATKIKITNTKQLLDYLATHPNATMRFYASSMIMNIHSDESYLSTKGTIRHASGHFLMGSFPKDDRPIFLNGAFYSICAILKFVASSAAEAELDTFFMNMKAGKIFRVTLKELRHPQPPTSIHCDNITTAGIANNTVKKHQLRSTEMKYFWACDQVKIGEFAVFWHPGQDKLGYYTSKHHDA